MIAVFDKSIPTAVFKSIFYYLQLLEGQLVSPILENFKNVIVVNLKGSC